MHPQIESDHPGVCPICNMELVLKISREIKDAEDSSANVRKEIGDVVLSSSQQLLANVLTETVTLMKFSNAMSFNGYIKIDEKNVRHISTQISGKILRMFVNFEGQRISKDEPVLEMYSPDILATEKEYLLALENYERLKNSKYNFVAEQAENLLNSTKTRLKLWDVSDKQIKELEETGEIKNYITVYSKYNGVITRKIDYEGHWAAAGEDIYDIADMTTVWVIANVPEANVNSIKLGQPALIYSVSYPGEVFNAKIDFINPVFNSETRTLEVRLDVSNNDYKLKPDMFVTVNINPAQHERNIAVPKNAVLRTGKMDIIYIKKDKNLFSPRMVTIGGERDGYYLIASGLNEGEEIVTSAGFLIDSESQIHSSGNNMQDMKMKSEEEPEFKNGKDVMKEMKH